MPRIRSANADFTRIEPLSSDAGYVHPASSRKGGVPLAFQLTSPFNRSRLLLPHALVLHVNPSTLSESYNHKVEVIQTKGGVVEQHWPPELTEISADGATGSFMNIYTGLTSESRERTIAHSRYRDLLDLYRNNGAVFNPFGAIVLQGLVMLMYDRGTFLGGFRSFEVEESDDSPFAFKLSWTFKVEHTIQLMSPAVAVSPRVPAMQRKNSLSPPTVANARNSVELNAASSREGL